MNAAPNIVALPSPQADFDRFWAVFPRRIAKLAAMRAWEKALRLAGADEIIAGVERYKRHKPDYADWCHPATWLNAGRWMDEYNDHVQAVGVTRSNCPSRSECIEFAKKQGDLSGFVLSFYERRHAENFANPQGLSWRDLFKQEFNRHQQTQTSKI